MILLQAPFARCHKFIRTGVTLNAPPPFFEWRGNKKDQIGDHNKRDSQNAIGKRSSILANDVTNIKDNLCKLHNLYF